MTTHRRSMLWGALVCVAGMVAIWLLALARQDGGL